MSSARSRSSRHTRSACRLLRTSGGPCIRRTEGRLRIHRRTDHTHPPRTTSWRACSCRRQEAARRRHTCWPSRPRRRSGCLGTRHTAADLRSRRQGDRSRPPSRRKMWGCIRCRRTRSAHHRRRRSESPGTRHIERDRRSRRRRGRTRRVRTRSSWACSYRRLSLVRRRRTRWVPPHRHKSAEPGKFRS